MDALKAELARVAADRDLAEAEVEAASSRLRAAGVGMKDPLVDGEGFPRADVDVHAVRADRHTVVVRGNDVKALTDAAGDLVGRIHALARAEGGVSKGAVPDARPAAAARPAVAAAVAPAAPSAAAVFAVVADVAAGSPAADAGVAAGDRVVRFGSVAARAGGGAPALAAALAATPAELAAAVRSGDGVEVELLRGGGTVRVRVAPREGWGGRGALGCRLVPP